MFRFFLKIETLGVFYGFDYGFCFDRNHTKVFPVPGLGLRDTIPVPGISTTQGHDCVSYCVPIVPLKHVPKGHVSFLKFQELSGTRIVLSPWNRIVSLNCVHGHVPESSQ